MNNRLPPLFYVAAVALGAGGLLHQFNGAANGFTFVIPPDATPAQIGNEIMGTVEICTAFLLTAISYVYAKIAPTTG